MSFEIVKPRRHSWTDSVPFITNSGQHYKTERTCVLCNLVKVTRHEPTSNPPHWREWWRNGERIWSDNTPPCASELVAA